MTQLDEPTSSATPDRPATDYDVVVIGGAVAGASAAILLRRWAPDARVLVVEFRETFPHKVGEATVEVSGLFLDRVLGLTRHLYQEHLPKHGLRYWWTDGPDRSLEEMTEVGPYEVSRIPSFQLDRSILDQHVLEVAEQAGAEVVRPGRVLEVDTGWPVSSLEVEDPAGVRRMVTTRWVIDASGRHAFLGRRKKLLERIDRHPTSAVWGRWHGVADLDGELAQGRDPEHPRLPSLPCSRRLATNHFMGDGWWCWVIPLSSGKTSIGVVWDRDLFDLPGQGNSRERYEQLVRSHPGLRELVAEAELDRDDAMAYSYVPYRCRRYMEAGWALIGDAAAFMDPYYSPGLDHVSISTYATARLLAAELRGELDERERTERIERHNREFLLSFDRWLDGLYTGKYSILGDAELATSAFMVETGLYYLGVVSPAYRDSENLANPPFGIDLPQARWTATGAAWFNRRLQRLAELRRRRGIFGRRNQGWRTWAASFGLGRRALPSLRRGLWLWIQIEVQTLLAAFRPRRGTSSIRAEPAATETPGPPSSASPPEPVGDTGRASA